MIEIFEGDSLEIEVTVTKDGTPLDLNGKTVTAAAANVRDRKVSASISITNAAGGKFTAKFPRRSLTRGSWRFWARVSDGTDCQVVAEDTIRVVRSLV